MSSTASIPRAAHHALRSRVPAAAHTTANKPIPIYIPWKAEDVTKCKKHILTYLYHPHPQPLNCTTFNSTRGILEDTSHPFHLRVKRRMEAFDPSKLHWRVHIPIEVSKKSAIRNGARKHVRKEFAQLLKGMGLERDGSVVDGEGQGLGGALLIVLSKHPETTLRLENDEVREALGTMLRKVMDSRASDARMSKFGPGGARQRHRWTNETREQE